MSNACKIKAGTDTSSERGISLLFPACLFLILGKHSETVITDSRKVTKELRSKTNNDRKSLLRNKGKEAIQPVVVHDDDDGFVDPPEHQIKHKPNIKTLAGPGQPKFVPYSDKKLKARVGVINLKNSVTGLSKQQRKAIKSMGFRPFLSLDIDTIPRRFAQWLVSNYDCDRNELNAGHHYIHVMSQTVKDVLGVPFGRLPVNEKNKPRMGSLDTLRICKSQYLGKSRITVKDVLEQMKNLWMPLPLLVKDVPEKTRKDLLNETMKLVLSNLKINYINKVDLIFIPIFKSEHVFLLVLDLKTPSFELFDNMVPGDEHIDRYEQIPTLGISGGAVKCVEIGKNTNGERTNV
ncbi:hypothetical protein R6Q59_010276 [Mikania micrantha]